MLFVFESVTGEFLVGVRVRPKMDLRLLLPLERLEFLIVTSESESESLVATSEAESSSSSDESFFIFELLLKIDPDNGLVS